MSREKYFYLMLKENFYDSEDIVILESMENGYLYSNILLKLYLKSLKGKGKLMYKEKIPYDVSILSKLVRHNVDVVEKAIKIFKELGLVELLDNGAMFMLDIENFIGKSSTHADRQRKYDRRISEEKEMLLLDENVDNTGVKETCKKSDKKSDEHINLDLNLNIKDRKKDINILFNKIQLLQLSTDEYDNILRSKGVYLENTEYIPEYIEKPYKLYQIAIKRLYDNKQSTLMEQVNLKTMEKVYGKILKADRIDNLEEYYIASLCNEVSK